MRSPHGHVDSAHPAHLFASGRSSCMCVTRGGCPNARRTPMAKQKEKLTESHTHAHAHTARTHPRNRHANQAPTQAHWKHGLVPNVVGAWVTFTRALRATPTRQPRLQPTRGTAGNCNARTHRVQRLFHLVQPPRQRGNDAVRVRLLGVRLLCLRAHSERVQPCVWV